MMEALRMEKRTATVGVCVICFLQGCPFFLSFPLHLILLLYIAVEDRLRGKLLSSPRRRAVHCRLQTTSPLPD